MSKLSDSTIIVESGTWKVRVYLGLAGIVAFVILAFLYRVEAGIIATAVGLAWAGRIAFGAYHAHKLAGFERRRLEAETSKAEAEAIRARAQSYFVEVNAGTFQLAGIAVERFYPSAAASKQLADIGLPQLPALVESTPSRRKLLDVEFVHLLIVGPSGSGKTTVLNHLVDNAPGNALIYALDPHAQFGEWPPRVNEIVGNGRDYPAIDARLLELISTMNRRYKGLESTSQEILILADEWLSIRDRCPAAEDFFTVIGSEARKVNMSLVIASISATVDDLNISGAIRDNLAQLTLSRSWQRDNLGELKWSRQDKEMVTLPGRYIPRTAALPAPAITPPAEDSTNGGTEAYDLIGFDPGPVALGPDPDELKIYQLYQEGKSLRAIWLEVYPGQSYGGHQASELKAILAKFGVHP